MIVALLLLPVAAALVSLYLPDLGRISYASALVLRDSRASSGTDPSAKESPVQQEAMDFRPNILFLSADGLPAERLSIYGYDRETTPFLASHERRMAAF